jgi:hypothetical protein
MVARLVCHWEIAPPITGGGWARCEFTPSSSLDVVFYPCGGVSLNAFVRSNVVEKHTSVNKLENMLT